MSQPVEELSFFDYSMEESEHLIRSGGFRIGEQEWPTRPADGPGSAFPFTATQTTGAFSGVATTYTVVSPNLNAPSPLFDKLSPTSDSLYSNGSSPAVSAHPNIAMCEYAPQQNSPNPYMGTYVSPASLQDSSSSGYDFALWVNPSTGFLGDGLGFDTSESMALASPGIFTEPEFTPWGDCGVATHQASYRPGSMEDSKSGPSQRKRAKMASQQDVAAGRSASSMAGRPLFPAGPVAGPSNTGDSGGQGKSKLRSASRSSKNVVHRLDETTDERKTRSAHNLVEKQYRNRLNAQFEALLNALPDSLRSPGGNTGPNDSDLNMDLGERRLSKGDVLELSTRYIRMLEEDCSRLEKERDDLNRDVEGLRSMFTNQSRSTSEGSGGEGMG